MNVASRKSRKPAKSDRKVERHPYGQRKLNLRFAIALSLLCLIAGACVYAIHSWQVDRSSSVILEQARKLRDDGRPDEALQRYLHYLDFRPRDVDAHAEMGRLIQDTAVSYNSLVTAYLAFETVLRDQPERLEIRRNIIELALRLQKFGPALDHLSKLREIAPEDSLAFYQTAWCYEGLGEYDKAVGLYLKAIEQAPQEIEFYGRLVRMILTRGRDLPLRQIDPLHREDATPALVAQYFMEQLGDQGLPRFQAFLERAKFYKEQGRLDDAEHDIQQALELAGDDADVLLAASEIAIARAEAARERSDSEQHAALLAAAIDYAQRGLALTPPDLRFFLMLSRAELQREDSDAAVAALRRGLAEVERRQQSQSGRGAPAEAPLYHEVIFSLADLLITLAENKSGDPDQTKLAEAAKLRDRLPQAGDLRALREFLQARQFIIQHRYLEARRVLETVQIGSASLQHLGRRVILELSRTYEHLRNPDERLNVLRKRLANDPLWMQGRIEVAAALADNNRIEEAIVEYHPFLRVPGVPTVVGRLQLLQQLARPDDRRDWSAVEETLRIADAVMPNSPELPALRAELLAQQRRFVEAGELLSQARARHADDVELQSTAALLALKRADRQPFDRIQDAAAILSEAESALGDHIEFRLARAELAVLKDFDDARRELLALVENVEPFDDTQRFRLLSGVARACARIGARQEARDIWTDLARRYPYDLTVPLVLVRFAAEQEDSEARERWLQEIRRIEGPNGPNGNFEAAAAILDRVQAVQTISPHDDSPASRARARDLREARQLLQAAAQQRPQWVAIPRALGILEDLAGSEPEAFEQFTRALELGDHSREVVARVVQGLYLRKRYEEADQKLQQLAEEQPDVISGTLARLAWRVAWQKQQFDRAIGLADAVADDSRNYSDHIWLAQLRFARGRRGDDVLEPLSQAIAVAPLSAPPRFALVTYLVRVGDLEQARAAVAAAEKELPVSEASLTAARCYELIGDVEAAEQRYLESLELDPQSVPRIISVADFYTRIGRADRADPYLEQLLDPNRQVPEFALAWARRRKAIIMAERGDYEATRRALQMLERNIGGGSKSSDILPDLRAKAMLLASRPTRIDRLAAIQIYEEIDRRQRLSLDERFRLAQLYDWTGQWPRAREIVVQLVSDARPAGLHVAWYVQALLRRNHLPDAEIWIGRLQKVEPNTLRTVAATVRWLAASGRAAEAVPLMSDYLAGRRTAAQSLKDLLAQQDAQEVLAILRSYLSDRLDRNGGRVLVQVRELLARNDQAAAIQLLTDYIDENRLSEASDAALDLFAATLFEEIGELAAAEQYFTQYVRRSENPRAIFLHATFLARQGRLDDALALCRQARERTPPELFVSAAASVIGHGSPTSAQLDEVDGWINDVLAANPSSAAALVARGDLHLVQLKFADAESAYRAALAENSQNVAAMNNLAWLLAYQKTNLPEADELLQQAFHLAGPIDALLDTRAMLHLARNAPDQALNDLTEAFVNTLSPYSALGHLHLAEACLAADKPREARDMLAKAEQYGLNIHGLHPLEREKYERLKNRLATESPAASTPPVADNSAPAQDPPGD